MPLSKYNRHFGGKRESASKALANMKREYGDAKGTSVFYATVQKRRKARERGRGLTNVMRGRRK